MKNALIAIIVLGNCYKSTEFWGFEVQVLKERGFNYGVLNLETGLPSFIPKDILKKYGKKIKCKKEKKWNIF